MPMTFGAQPQQPKIPNLYGLKGNDLAYFEKVSQAAGRPADISSAGGTGLQFLSGLSLRGRDLLGDSNVQVDPFSGDETTYNTPFMLGRFLAGEFGPGGALAPEAQSGRVAMGISGILAGGRRAASMERNRLAASGVARRFAASATGAVEDAALDEAMRFRSVEAGALAEQRYDTMLAYLNSVAQTAIAEKNAKLNKKIAYKGAEMGRDAAVIGAIGSIGGAALGAYGRIAAAGA